MTPETPLERRFSMDGAREILDRTAEVHFLRGQVEALEEAVLTRPGIALDLARSLIETTCKTILEDLGIEISGSWDCPRLMKETLARMRVSSDASPEVREGVKDVVRGVSTVVNGLCALRNREGAASHGRDAFSKNLAPPRALLAARASDAIVCFLWSVHKGWQEGIIPERLHYEDNPEFNDWIDSQYESPVKILGVSLTQSEALFRTDRAAYKDRLIEFISSWESEPPDNT